MIVPQSSNFKAPVTLGDNSGVPKTGVAYGSATVYYQKPGGAAVHKILTAPDWVEISAAGMPGVYDLQFAGSELDTVGFFKYSVQVTGSPGFSGILEVQPVDLAGLQADLDSRLDVIQQRIGVPQMGSGETHDLSYGQLALRDAITGATTTTSDAITSEVQNVMNLLGTPQHRDPGGGSEAPNTVSGDIDNVLTNLATAGGSGGTDPSIGDPTDWGGDTLFGKLNVVVDQVGRSLGMMHENSVLDMTTYDSSNNMLSGRLRTYDSKSNALAARSISPDAYTTGLVAQYSIIATYLGSNLLTYTVTREVPDESWQGPSQGV